MMVLWGLLVPISRWRHESTVSLRNSAGLGVRQYGFKCTRWLLCTKFFDKYRADITCSQCPETIPGQKANVVEFLLLCNSFLPSSFFSLPWNVHTSCLNSHSFSLKCHARTCSSSHFPSCLTWARFPILAVTLSLTCSLLFKVFPYWAN